MTSELTEPTPEQATVDFTDGLLGDPKFLRDQPLGDAGTQTFADRSNTRRIKFCHAVARPLVIATMKALVYFIRALIAPCKVSRVTARAVSAEMPSRLAWRTRTMDLLSDESMRVGDAVRPRAKTYASVSLQQEALKGPALLEFSNLDFVPKPVVEGALHWLNGNKPLVTA